MVVVVGMGRSGLAVSRLLSARGIEVFASDASPNPPMKGEFVSLGIELETGRHSADRFRKAAEIVVSPGVRMSLEALEGARKSGIPVVSELEVASRYLSGDIVAITGSNGKTTTTTLASEILRSGSRPVQTGGNIGNAASELVATSTVDTINVLEVSSFQLDGIQKFRPHVAALLNITPDHLDRYSDFGAYRLSKFSLFRNQTPEDFAVINLDDPRSFPFPVTIAARKRFFSRSEGFSVAAGILGEAISVWGDPVMPVSDLPLPGAHNVENVLAAILIAEVYAIPLEAMAATVRSFKGVEHRLETVATIGGIDFVNDSKATNVDSAIKAVEAFDRSIVLILGGQAKGSDFTPLIDVSEGRVRQILTLGAAAGELEQAIGDRVAFRRVGTVREAVTVALDLARPGDVVLLAPACASFDMYVNYEERGRDFKAAVLDLVKVANQGRRAQ